MLWTVEADSDRGLSGFFRASVTPSDHRIIDLYIDGGLGDKGVLALGLAYVRISSRASQINQETHAMGEADRPPANFEALLELSYQAQITPWWFLQPDLQYVFHPGARLANPNDPPGSKAIPDALVFGLRTGITF